MRYLVEYGRRTDMAIVHVQTAERLSPAMQMFEAQDEPVGRNAELVAALLEVIGVERVFVDRWHITFHKDPVFDWGDVLFAVLPLLAEHLNGGVPLQEAGPPIVNPLDPDASAPLPTAGTIN